MLTWNMDFLLPTAPSLARLTRPIEFCLYFFVSVSYYISSRLRSSPYPL